MYRVCDNISLLFIVMFLEKGQSVIIAQRMPGSQYKLACATFGQYFGKTELRTLGF